MRILHDFADPAQHAPALLILLPGALQQPEEFVQAGFVDALRRRGLALDLALADLGLRYITETTDGTAIERIHEHLLQPARLRYRRVWLGGISIGGFIAIACADRYPGFVDGLCLLSPYPGNRILTGEIKAAGGVEEWSASHADANDSEVRVWQWLKSYRKRAGAPQLHMGYGRDDRFAAGQQLMAQALPPRCIDTVAGGHDWPAWSQLWGNFLDRTASHIGHEIMDTTA